MSNELVKPTTMDAAVAAYLEGNYNPHEEYAKTIDGSTGAFLKFSGNTGRWTMGDDDLGDGFLMAFNLFYAKRGWIGWQNGKPIKRILEPFLGGQRLPSASELEPIVKVKESDGWRFVIECTVVDFNTYTEMALSLPAEEDWRPIQLLMKEYGESMRLHTDKATRLPEIPIIECSSKSFEGKGGTKYKPDLTLVEWMPQAELDDLRRTAKENADDGEETEEDEPEAIEAEEVPEEEKKSVEKKAPAADFKAGREQRRGRRQ